jgi:6-phosphogluconate dehydrogenase (decarboxylating)
MQMGMIGLGRMGANMVRRLLANKVLSAMRHAFGGHEEKRS